MVKVVVSFCIFASIVAQAGLKEELERNFLPEDSGRLTFDIVSQKLHEMDAEADLLWKNVRNRKEYDALRKTMHSKMMSAMGDWPERTPLNAKTLATIEREGYKIEKVLFESMEGVFVTVNFFIPNEGKFKRPFPAVVMSCGHSYAGKDADRYLRACVIAVKNGFAALMYDPYEQGERRRAKRIENTVSHNTIGINASLLGWSMPLLRTWDGMRAIDYVQSRPEVDKEKIGFMGLSGGGTMTSLITAADWRVKVSAPACYLTSLRSLCESIGPQDAEQNIFGQLKFGLNHTGYVFVSDAKVAVMGRFRDFFPIYGTLDLFRTVQTVAAKFGAEENYALVSAAGPHGWVESTQTASVDWMRTHLKGEKGLFPFDDRRYRALDVGFDLKKADQGLSPEERGVLPTKSIFDIPNSRDIHDVLRDRLKRAVAARPKYSVSERAAIAAKLAGVKKPSEMNVMVKELPPVSVGEATLTRLVFIYPDGLMLPACWLEPKKCDKAKNPVIMIGSKGRGEWAPAVLSALADGVRVLVADITGYGDIGGMEDQFYDSRECPEEGVSVMLYLMGESMTGRRATDMLVIGDWVQKKTSLQPILAARATAAIPAAHAYADSSKVFKNVFISQPPMSWTKFVEKGVDASPRYTYMVVNALLHYDWVDLLPVDTEE